MASPKSNTAKKIQMECVDPDQIAPLFAQT